MQCKQIDFLGSRKRNKARDLKKSIRVAKKVANAVRHGSPRSSEQLKFYCDTREWLTDNPRKNNEGSCNMIPLQNTIPRNARQQVLGRMTTLSAQQECPNRFILLDSEDWDDLYRVNDLFVQCSTLSKADFPIRIVFSSADYLRDVPSYDTSILQRERPVILARELCQLQSQFQLYFYQSIEEPNLFFASKKSPLQIRNFRKYNVRLVQI